MFNDQVQGNGFRVGFLACRFHRLPTPLNVAFKVFVVHPPTHIRKVGLQLFFMQTTMMVSPFHFVRIISGLFERRKQFSERHRASFLTPNPLVKQAGESRICGTVENGLGEEVLIIIKFRLPPEVHSFVPFILFFGQLNPVKQSCRLMMEHFPSQAYQASTRRKVQPIAQLHPRRKGRNKLGQIHIPRVKCFLFDQGEHEGDRAVKRVMEALMLSFLSHGNGHDALAKDVGLLTVLTRSQQTIDDVLLEEPLIKHALTFNHKATSDVCLVLRFPHRFARLRRQVRGCNFSSDIGSFFDVLVGFCSPVNQAC